MEGCTYLFNTFSTKLTVSQVYITGIIYSSSENNLQRPCLKIQRLTGARNLLQTNYYNRNITIQYSGPDTDTSNDLGL